MTHPNIYDKKHPQTIKTMFSRIAKRYDTGNAILSLGMHTFWNKKLIKKTLIDKNPSVFVDLCAGTGEIAFNYLGDCKKNKHAILIDFCAAMLDVAKKKSEKKAFYQNHTIDFIEGDAQKIPLEDNSVEAVTIAYGIRNVANPSQCFAEVYRILCKGGSLGIVELTPPKNPFIRFGHKIYLQSVLPLVGKWITNDGNAYEYLQQSIQTFIPAKKLQILLQEQGFMKVTATPLLGGIATLLSAQK